MNVVLLAVAVLAAGSLDAPRYRARESARATLERLPSAPASVGLAVAEGSGSPEARQAAAQIRLRMRARLIELLAADNNALITYACTAPVADRPWRAVYEVGLIHEARGDAYWRMTVSPSLFQALRDCTADWPREDDYGLVELPFVGQVNVGCVGYYSPETLTFAARWGGHPEAVSEWDW
jgi:hypothetical protein